MQKIQFDYFTGMEAEQYSFYRVPKVLFTEPCFKTLSCEAKVLYGLMLDRMSLMAGFRGQSIHYLHCGRNCRVDELRNSKGSETGKRAGQQ